ncbi:MAG: DUF2335 domain-containing protein [Deltaproteobacteria bacterium]|nr:DUF2335 domain-containing protein [Deltaproteobacteria bacterium]
MTSNKDSLIPSDNSSVSSAADDDASPRSENPSKTVAHHIEQRFSGPLPPPKILEQYERVLLGSAERILKMAEKEQGHRHSIQKQEVDGVFGLQRWGQLFGFLIAMVAFIVGGILVYLGHDWVGGILMGGTVVSLVTVFVIGTRRKPEKENDEADENE